MRGLRGPTRRSTLRLEGLGRSQLRRPKVASFPDHWNSMVSAVRMFCACRSGHVNWYGAPSKVPIQVSNEVRLPFRQDHAGAHRTVPSVRGACGGPREAAHVGTWPPRQQGVDMSRSPAPWKVAPPEPWGEALPASFQPGPCTVPGHPHVSRLESGEERLGLEFALQGWSILESWGQLKIRSAAFRCLDSLRNVAST